MLTRDLKKMWGLPSQLEEAVEVRTVDVPPLGYDLQGCSKTGRFTLQCHDPIIRYCPDQSSALKSCDPINFLIPFYLLMSPSFL